MGYSPRGRKETRLSDFTFISIIVIEAIVDFLGGSVVKNPLANARDTGLIPGLGRPDPWRRKWHPLQYFCLGNPMDRGAWQAMVCGVAGVGHDLATKPPHPDITGSFFQQGR